ncbi:c-type cytochrome [Tropicibacter sp. S64]|uniref:c-type cytochrome n=1 Tax=Tropicibacter sp. S64 TaxID=3415122 RepID=UPI003C7CAFBF
MHKIAMAMLGVALLGACQDNNVMPGPQDGRALFMANCAVCHGADATGNGEMARAMAKPPKNLTLIKVRHGDTFPRAKIMSIIDGYARSKTMTGPGMPEFGVLLEGDLVPFDSGDGIQTPTPRKLVALLEYLESIQAER